MEEEKGIFEGTKIRVRLKLKVEERERNGAEREREKERIEGSSKGRRVYGGRRKVRA